MKKGIDTSAQNELTETVTAMDGAISEELQTAIQNLIYRLREAGPIR